MMQQTKLLSRHLPVLVLVVSAFVLTLGQAAISRQPTIFRKPIPRSREAVS